MRSAPIAAPFRPPCGTRPRARARVSRWDSPCPPDRAGNRNGRFAVVRLTPDMGRRPKQH
ncbi:hypothetical protein Misp04_03240 [Micromonospora sp. NBRC 101691]|nr:hypothetical protein Misp04_03240 [Micromonospora sp. NBRC 101691]